MNSYEERQEERRARLGERAEAAQREADAAFAAEHRILDVIPLGQPILIGHHSERRHRRDLERANRLTQKGVDALDKAAELARRAEAVGTGGVSSDDPEAGAKLESKAAALEAQRDRMKTVNAVFDKARRAYLKTASGGAGDEAAAQAAGWAAVVAASYFTVEAAAREAALLARCGHDRPYPGYALTNIGARIRDAKKREAELSARETAPEREPITGPGYQIAENRELNRVQVTFSTKPPKEVCQQMRRAGFRWSPSEGAWQRQLNNAGWYAATNVIDQVKGKLT